MTHLNLHDVEATFHRNGVSGMGVTVAAFIYDGEPMLAVTFRHDEDGAPQIIAVFNDNLGFTAVLALRDLAQLNDGTLPIDKVRAWRGDEFEDTLFDTGLLAEALKRHWQRTGVVQ